MKKVLVITYYWPPSGGAGVQRWLKFVKYLRDHNWEPVVYTAEGGEAPVIDPSLQKDVPENITVIKRPIWEPYSWYKKFVGQKKEEKINTGFLSESKKPKKAQKIAVWIRGNLFIPDARCFWIKPSIKFLTQYLKKNPIDAIISTGPPHSMHLIAKGIRENTGIPWLADFRDPWTFIDFYDQLMLTKSADLKHKRLEKGVLETADELVVVSWNWAKDFEKLTDRKFNVITNGFDPDDFKQGEELLSKDIFTINHIGSLNKDRNPKVLWKVIANLREEHPEIKEKLRIRLIGKTDIHVFESLEENDLMSVVEKVEYLPHEEVLKTLTSSHVLLLALNDTPNVNGIIPGKIFEYLAAKRPVLCIGDVNGDSARIIKETATGITVGFKEEEEMKKTLLSMFRDFEKGQLKINAEALEKYSRKNLTGEVANLLNKMTA